MSLNCITEFFRALKIAINSNTVAVKKIIPATIRAGIIYFLVFYFYYNTKKVMHNEINVKFRTAVVHILSIR